MCCRVRVSSRAVKICQNKQITGKNPIRESKQRNVQYKKMGNEQKSRLVIFVSSVSRHFGLVARFAYAVKEIIKIKKKIFVMRALKKKKKSVLFFTPWLPGKSDLGKVLKWRKLKRPLKLCKIVFTLFSLIHTYTHVVLFFNDMYFWLLNFCFIEGH